FFLQLRLQRVYMLKGIKQTACCCRIDWSKLYNCVSDPSDALPGPNHFVIDSHRHKKRPAPGRLSDIKAGTVLFSLHHFKDILPCSARHNPKIIGVTAQMPMPL